MRPPIDVDALFLGPKSENYAFFKEMLGFLMDDQAQWRRDFHPHDAPAVTRKEQRNPRFKATLLKTRQTLAELAGRLQVSSMPWFSPRYLGHMTSDTLMAADLANMLALLYNPNNCAYEGSPATTALELEAGRELAGLMGYDPAKAWGHITSGGTIANYEGLWLARNLKSIPRALRKVLPALVRGLSDWELSNLPSPVVLDLFDQALEAGRADEVQAQAARGRGLSGWRPGKVLVPQSRHYSWSKAVDLLGIGQENLVPIPVRGDFRMDVGRLDSALAALARAKEPVLAVVAVVGTTEEGAVDPVHAVADLRREWAARGLSFHLHVDAAYGGYARSLFVGPDGRFLGFPQVRRLFGRGFDWPPGAVRRAFQAMAEADTITVDPHKLGYVPYSAGALLAKDKRLRNLISYHAAYVFEKGEESPLLLGSYILEGSKPGAAAAAVWAAHKVVPLDVTGYGRLIGASIEGAGRFHRALLRAGPITVGATRFLVRPLVRPDLNIVVFAFNEKGNRSLERMNALNRRLFDRCSYRSGPVYLNDFITSKTELARDEYGDAPRAFVRSLGIPSEEWDRVGRVFVLRSCVVTPTLAKNTSFERYWAVFLRTLQNKLRLAAEEHP